MAQTIRALAAKPNLPEFNPKTSCVGKKEEPISASSLTRVYMYIGTCKHVSMSMRILKRKKDIEKSGVLAAWRSGSRRVRIRWDFVSASF